MRPTVSCWLCGAEYRASVHECADCGLALLPAGEAPTADEARVRSLADAHLGPADHKRVRSALAALPDVLLGGEAIIWLTDAEHVGRPGVLAITTRALCFVPVDEERDPGAIDLDTIIEAVTWPGDGGQLRIDASSGAVVFTEVGRSRWLDQFSEVLRAAIGSPEGALALARHYDAAAQPEA
jgi:hypothetical protein